MKVLRVKIKFGKLLKSKKIDNNKISALCYDAREFQNRKKIIFPNLEILKQAIEEYKSQNPKIKLSASSFILQPKKTETKF